MHFETSAGFHKKLLKRKQSNLKSILVFERKKNKQKKPLQLWRKSGSEAWATNISYFAFGRLHVRFESQPEVVCRLHHVLRGTDQDLVDWTGHRPRRLGHRTGLWGGERERRKKWWWMSDGERLPRCFVLRTRKTSKLGGAPEVENPINYAARGHTIFITNTVHTPCLPGMCENPRLMCVPLCPLRASWLFSWRRWTHDWSCGAFVVAKRRPKKPISGTAALFHIHKFEY